MNFWISHEMVDRDRKMDGCGVGDDPNLFLEATSLGSVFSTSQGLRSSHWELFSLSILMLKTQSL